MGPALSKLILASLQGAVILCRAARDTEPLDSVEREVRRTLRAAIDEARS